LRIALVTVGEPLPEADLGKPRLLRTGVLAERLANRGHHVDWWTSTFDHYGKRQRSEADASYMWRGVEIHMLKSVGYRSNVSPRRFVEHYQIAHKFAGRIRRGPKPDVVLASLPTLELAVACVRFGREVGVPVLVDVRDLWPDAILDLAPSRLRGIAAALFWWMRRAAVEALRDCSGIIGISDAYLAWGLRHARRPRRDEDAVFPLGYVPPVETPEGSGLAALRLRAFGVDEQRTLCWYVGSFGRLYDLEPVLEAARLAESEFGDTVQFVISGDGELGATWREKAAAARNVIFTGWIGADEINWLRARVAVGFQPYLAGAPQGLANKLFEYLSAGIPVVSSLQGENAMLIAEHGCGVTYLAGNGASCFEALRPLLRDSALQKKMGSNGRRLFVERFDADKVFDGLADHLEHVACSRNAAIS
jgi:glycosyltransferase involved in cell wall biosynthesis